MKRTTAMLAGALLVLSLTMPATATPPSGDDPEAVLAQLHESAGEAVAKARWDNFSKNLVEALSMKHDGVREAALRMIIQYGDRLAVKDAVFDVMRIYRDHDNVYLRRMALVALGEMKSTWAIRFLERSEAFETVPELQHTIRAVVSQSQDRKAI